MTGAAVVCVGDRDRGCRPVSLSGGALCEREWDQGDGQPIKEVNRASDKMRFNVGVMYAFITRIGDFRVVDSFFIVEDYGRGAGLGRGRGVDEGLANSAPVVVRY